MNGAPEGFPHPFRRSPTEGTAPSIAPEELARRREGPDPPVLVDVRSLDERHLARFPGDRWIPTADLATRAGEVPVGPPVVLYDHRGESAPRAAGWLRTTLGVEAVYLDGGIDAYAQRVDPEVGRYAEGPDPVVVVQLPRPATGCLAYFLGDPSARRAILVDPGADPAPYLARLKAGDWTLDAIVETHTHADHLAGHAPLHARTGAPIYVSHRSPAAYPHRALAAGDTVEAGALALSTLETPGHTRDHLTLRLGDRIFTGDTLLLGACGRSDLGDGDPRLLYESLHETLGRLPDATEVYPAHFGLKHALPTKYVSTLGFERASNEALRVPTEEEFVRYMTEGWPPKPADFERIVAANLADAPGGD
ncbi:MAG TPA: MBL fold metallo-hydrolase [Thermoplasmata archaeon]|nr:MBL fold metallo-hydrolase [Thermoplasmata archaeon]